jgi:hypothetical protein
MRNALIALAGIAFWSCMTDSSRSAGLAYRYDHHSGTCVDASGYRGFNAYVPGQIPAAKNAECMDLSGVDLDELEGGVGARPKVPLKGWNFQGADFSEAALNYALIKGRVDSFTRFPPLMRCKVEGDVADCEH